MFVGFLILISDQPKYGNCKEESNDKRPLNPNTQGVSLSVLPNFMLRSHLLHHVSD